MSMCADRSLRDLGQQLVDTAERDIKGMGAGS